MSAAEASLIPTVDVAWGLAIDDDGTRMAAVSATLWDRAKRVNVIVTDEEGDVAMIALRVDECREFAAWLWSAANVMDGAPC